MRTDLITAFAIHQWLQEVEPDLAAQWPLEVDNQIKGIVQQVQNFVPDFAPQIAAQHAVAKTVIEHWGLTDVALFSGGTPSPLSPDPDQLRFYSDISPEVVAEAAAAGYKAKQVDVTKVDDLKKLDGATTAIATGLVLFLPDPAIKKLFNNLEDADFDTFVFNQVRAGEAGGAADLYAKMGITLYTRDRSDIESLIPEGWSFEMIQPMSDLLRQAPLGAHFAGLVNRADVYKAVRR